MMLQLGNLGIVSIIVIAFALFGGQTTAIRDIDFFSGKHYKPVWSGLYERQEEVNRKFLETLSNFVRTEAYSSLRYSADQIRAAVEAPCPAWMFVACGEVQQKAGKNICEELMTVYLRYMDFMEHKYYAQKLGNLNSAHRSRRTKMSGRSLTNLSQHALEEYDMNLIAQAVCSVGRTYTEKSNFFLTQIRNFSSLGDDTAWLTPEIAKRAVNNFCPEQLFVICGEILGQAQDKNTCSSLLENYYSFMTLVKTHHSVEGRF
eukprot:Lankesteria_metandrocarpae@DN528_c0_g1_i1.p1